MAVAEPHSTHDSHDDHHDHGEFIAHHFDSPEQQYDSGKLGIWVFLVTEILFFGGLFTAYTLWRVNHPDIYDQAHVYLDRTLGGLNTIVLIFSSLTMALGVHAAQNANNKKCALYVLITMVCAAMFLGVKAVEYSHKWDMGIFPAGFFNLTDHHSTGISPWLIKLSAIPALLLVVFVVGSIVSKLTDKAVLSKFLLGLAIMVGGYFLGAASGKIYQDNFAPTDHASLQQPDAPLVLHALTAPVIDEAEEGEHAEGDHTEGEHAAGEHDHELAPGMEAADGPSYAHDEQHDGGHSVHAPLKKMDRDVGIFFSIYYCMTGLHAIHIIGGIIALSWLYWRSLAGHWRQDYFGPVDYVGLYWHLVDLIWIYLFPLLYLID